MGIRDDGERGWEESEGVGTMSVDDRIRPRERRAPSAAKKRPASKYGARRRCPSIRVVEAPPLITDGADAPQRRWQTITLSQTMPAHPHIVEAPPHITDGADASQPCASAIKAPGTRPARGGNMQRG